MTKLTLETLLLPHTQTQLRKKDVVFHFGEWSSGMRQTTERQKVWLEVGLWLV